MGGFINEFFLCLNAKSIYIKFVFCSAPNTFTFTFKLIPTLTDKKELLNY